MSEVGQFGLAVSGCAYRRKLFVTGKGYVGVVPPGSGVGDEICIFRGSQTPSVIRERKTEGHVDGGVDEKSYTLVGECYVHGMMDGEMWSLGKKYEFFELH